MRIVAIPIALLSACPPLQLKAEGSQSGIIHGFVKNEQGLPLSGVPLSIQGKNLQGIQRTVTDAQGKYRFVLLPPGPYSISAHEKSYQSIQVNVQLPLGSTVNLPIILPHVGEATAPVIRGHLRGEASLTSMTRELDLASARLETNYLISEIDKLPLSPDYDSVVGLTPGFTGDNMMGGGRWESLYLLDGVDITDPVVGSARIGLTQNAIEEIQVLTTTRSAEYGRCSGAAINIQSRIGGNTFSGDLRYRVSNPAWDARAPLGETVPSQALHQPAVSIGGYLVRDHCWFFLSFQKQQNTSFRSFYSLYPNLSNPSYFRRDADVRYNFHLTISLSPNDVINFTHSENSKHIFNADDDAAPGEEAALTNNKEYSRLFNLNYLRKLGNTGTLETRMAQNISVDETHLKNERWSFLSMEDLSLWENGRFSAQRERRRDQVNAVVQIFPGFHHIKTGFDYQKTTTKNDINFSGGGYGVYFSSKYPDGTYLMQPEVDFLVYYPPLADRKNSRRSYALYFHDTWQIRSNLTIDTGLRYEHFTAHDDAGRKALDYGLFQPRFSMTWNLSDWSLGIGCGRYQEAPSQSNLEYTSSSPRRTYMYFSYLDGDPHLRESYSLYPIVLNDADKQNTGLFKPNTTAPIMDEINLSFKWRQNMAMSYQTQLVYRVLTNPVGVATYYDNTEYHQLHEEIQSFPEAWRRYLALITSVERGGRNWNFQINWTWSRLWGNGAFWRGGGHGFLDRGAYCPEWYVRSINAVGALESDRTHVLKVLGSYIYRKNKFAITNGIRFQYQTGTPTGIIVFRQDDQAPSWVQTWMTSGMSYYHEGNRDSIRHPNTWFLDYSINLNIEMYKTVKLFFKLELFNLFNHQQKRFIDTFAYYNNQTQTIELLPSFGQAIGSGSYIEPRKVAYTIGINF